MTPIEIATVTYPAELTDPYPQTSAAWAAANALARHENSTVYHAAQRNYVLPNALGLPWQQVQARVAAQVDQQITARLATIHLRDIVVDHYLYTYSAGPHNIDDRGTIPVQRWTITADVRDAANQRVLVAYVLHYEKTDIPIFHINGHFGSRPSRCTIGVEPCAYAGVDSALQLALRGYQVITYDDSRSNEEPPRDYGESHAANHDRDGMVHTLEDLMIIDQALLHQRPIYLVGLSGGAARGYFYLHLGTAQIHAAYLAGFNRPLWIDADALLDEESPYGYDPDMIAQDGAPGLYIQHADLVFLGLAQGVPIAIAHNRDDSGLSKYGVQYEVLPALMPWLASLPGALQLRGNDPNLDGLGGDQLGHVLWIDDVVDFLAQH